ncbi:MAG TPA: lipoprotein [Dokdonella sp.]|nr:lipoprotein [Dokdonella sp.]HET9031407.1 lipoprotein [Dokdonella sp.]
MLRTFRNLLCLLVLVGLVGCGNKGDLIKPSAPTALVSADAAQG